METLLVFIIAVLALVVSTIAACYARAADSFADKCHQRLNGAMDKFTRHGHEAEMALLGVRKLNHEVFGTGRSGEYPDMGLREWARVWRGRLRTQVGTAAFNIGDLQSRLGEHEAQAVIPNVSQADISSLDNRIDTVSQLRHLDQQDLQEGQRAHNELALAFADLCDKLGYEADEATHGVRLKATKLARRK